MITSALVIYLPSFVHIFLHLRAAKNRKRAHKVQWTPLLKSNIHRGEIFVRLYARKVEVALISGVHPSQDIAALNSPSLSILF